MRAAFGLLTIFALLWTQGCLGDEDRCGEGERYEDGSCVPALLDGGGDTLGPDSSSTDTTQGDGALLPSGMGDVCSGQEDCAGKEADYCLIQPPSSTGSCTVKDCNATDDDCPTGYRCCDFSIASVPNFCTTDADYATLKSMSMCL